MKRTPSRRLAPIRQLLEIMALLRSPGGCPWDREQGHRSLRFHAVEEVYELIDAIEGGNDHEMAEELGDLLLQVVFHCQLGQERGAFDFDHVAQHIVDKLIRRHPHVFGDVRVKNVGQVWANWDRIKQAEAAGTDRERRSALDGIPRHLPALLRAEKLAKKAGKAGLPPLANRNRPGHEWGGVPTQWSRAQLAAALFELAAHAQSRGWSAEELLRAECQRRERAWRRSERRSSPNRAGGEAAR